MPVREMIEIDEELCDGCGQCATACAEGAIAIIDGKAKLVSDVYCDGLGACIGHCPRGALTIVRRDAAAFDEVAVERHLERMRRPAPMALPVSGGHGGGCPGSRVQTFGPRPDAAPAGAVDEASQLRQWPIQLHLLPPAAPFLAGADLLLAADCVAYSVAGFHRRYLVGHALAVACPKLDSNQEVYLAKLVQMIDQAAISSLTVMVMEVPCCGGLVRLAQQAAAMATRRVPVRLRVVSVRGEIIAEQEAAAV